MQKQKKGVMMTDSITTSQSDTITAVATGVGGAIALIRLSGSRAIEICSTVFRSASGKQLAQAEGYTLHYGHIMDGERIVDDVIVSLFRTPRSYTGEDMVEVSCHASTYIQSEIIKLFIQHGARTAEAGEFTIRAFLAGKLDLAQAEAIADVIASTDRATHALASNQMRGGYSAEFASLRGQLITLVSLLELELDFGEEDVEFADRRELETLLAKIERRVNELLESFKLSNVIKEGVAVAIVGKPNVGKSTLLNALLKDDRAMVSDIAGTTRDVIEESLNIGGIKFRFIDTAGIRTTDDTLERMGIERTFGSIERANIVLYMIEASEERDKILRNALESLHGLRLREEQKLLLVINKIDKIDKTNGDWLNSNESLTNLEKEIHTACGQQLSLSGIAPISAKSRGNIESLVTDLLSFVDSEAVFGDTTIVSNSRHYEALLRASESLSRAHSALVEGISTDFLTQDIHESLHHLGTITGEITTDDILTHIFSNFCIGK